MRGKLHVIKYPLKHGFDMCLQFPLHHIQEYADKHVAHVVLLVQEALVNLTKKTKATKYLNELEYI